MKPDETISNKFCEIILWHINILFSLADSTYKNKKQDQFT